MRYLAFFSQIGPPIFFMCMGIIMLAIVVWGIWDSLRKRKKMYEELGRETQPDPAESVGAVVTDGRSQIIQYGSARFPHHRVAYYLTFVTDHGKTVEYEVPQHIYQYGLERRSGMLITVNGKFFDFGEGEPIR